MTNSSTISAVQAERAREIWRSYQAQHDVTSLNGQAVGIDPESERVWFGADAREVVRLARLDGCQGSLLCLRVGQVGYWRKGGRFR